MSAAPRFLGRLTPLPARRAAAEPLGVGSNGDLATYGMTCQEQSNWCWAAVTQAVLAARSVSETQEAVATGHIQASGRPQGCAPPNDGVVGAGACGMGVTCTTPCNGPHSLGAVLGERQLLQGYLSQGAAVSFAQVVSEISQRRKPVPCRIDWNGAGGHFVTIIAWRETANGQRFVTVLDPLVPGLRAGAASRREIAFGDFIARYQSGSGGVGTNNYAYAVT